MAETVATGLSMVNTAKNNVDASCNQGQLFTTWGIPPSQVKPKNNYSDVYNSNSLFEGHYIFFFY